MKQLSSIASCFMFPGIVFLVHLIAVKVLNLYSMFPDLDIPIHFLGGLSIAYACARLLSYLQSEKITATLDRILFVVLLLCVTATAAVFWEFAEFISDRFLSTHLQLSLANTMRDQFLGILGGGTWALIYFKRDLK